MNAIKIMCLETGVTFASGREAAKANNISPCAVSKSARKILPVNGMNFRFIDKNGNIIETPSKPKFSRMPETENTTVIIHNKATVTAEPGEHINRNSKAVCCLETGDVFPSLLDMAKAHGVNSGSLSKCCNGTLNTVGGMHYFFVARTTENFDALTSQVRNLKAQVDDPEYLEWKKAKAQKQRLDTQIHEQEALVKGIEIQLAHEKEILEALVKERSEIM